MENLDQTTWVEKSKNDPNAVILDVRTPNECAQGIIEGAIIHDFFDAEKFINAIDQMDKSKSYYIYCRSGNRSGQACQIMEQKGFKNTFNLVGGILEWQGDLV